MCSIGNSTTMSLAGSMPTSTLLGAASVNTGEARPGAKRVLGGTLLGGAGLTPGGEVPGSRTPPGGGGGGGGRYNVNQF